MKVEKQTVYKLLLTQEEAWWLKGLVQNPLHKDESPQVATLRKALWEALDEGGVTSG